MKWIGQHIYDQISRFRNDVYLEDISTGTIASGAHLGLDSNNKIVKAVDGGGDLTSIVAGNDLGGTNLTGPTPTLNLNSTLYGVSAIHNESLVVGWGPESQVDFDTEGRIRFKLGNANQVEIIDGAILPITTNDIDLGAGDPDLYFKDLWLKGDANIEGNISGTWAGAVIPSAKLDADTAHLSADNVFTGGTNTFSSATASKPLLTLKTTHTTKAASAELQFLKDAADTEDGENLGIITFYGENESNANTKFAHIKGSIQESDAGAEGGSIKLAVATEDGEMINGLVINDGNAEDEVDVTIGSTITSMTTIAGNLTINGDTITTSGDMALVATGNDVTVDTDNFTLSSATSGKPKIQLKSTSNDADGAYLYFNKSKLVEGVAVGADNDVNGSIVFFGHNANGNPAQYGSIVSSISEADLNSEAGKLTLSVNADHFLTQSPGLILEGEHATAGEVDVTIANGTASTTTIAGDLQVVGGNIIGTTDGDIQIDSDNHIILNVDNDNDASNQFIKFADNGVDRFTFNVAKCGAEINGNNPAILLNSTSDDNLGNDFLFKKERIDSTTQIGEVGDNIGTIHWQSYNDGTPALKTFATMLGEIADPVTGSEAGNLTLAVASYDGTLTNGLQLLGDTNADGEVDVTIASGAASTTTVAGTLTMGSTAALTNAGLVAVANQSNITGVGTLSSGDATGIVTDASTSAKGIASFSSDNFAASSGSITIKDGGVDLAVEVTGVLPTANIADDAITEDKLANTLLAEIDANTAKNTSPNIYGEYIKLLPNDFETNGDGGNTKFGAAFNKTAGQADYGMRTSSSDQEMFAFVNIPQGYKATKVEVYGRRARVVEVFEVQINATTVVSKGTGNCWIPSQTLGDEDITLSGGGVTSTATNLLMIEVVTTAATGDRMYGGRVLIEAI